MSCRGSLVVKKNSVMQKAFKQTKQKAKTKPGRNKPKNVVAKFIFKELVKLLK